MPSRRHQLALSSLGSEDPGRRLNRRQPDVPAPIVQTYAANGCRQALEKHLAI